jgi:hypothetical protein
MKEYKIEVTRTEIHSVSNLSLEQERMFRKGQQDRRLGNPCTSANGAYLNGFYDPEAKCYYVPETALHLV